MTNEPTWQLWDVDGGYMVGNERDNPIAFRYHYEAQKVQGLLNALEAKCARYEAALRFYAVREAYLHDDCECAPICTDEGEIARQALNPSSSLPEGAE